MSDKPPPKLTLDSHEPGASFVAELDQTPWRRLAEAATVEEFATSWLELESRMVGGVSGGTVVLEGEDGKSLTPVAFWPGGAWDRKSLTGVIQRCLKERKGVLMRNDTERELASEDELRFHLAYPIRVGQKLHGVAALQITPRPQIQLQSAMRQLQWGIAWLQNWILRRAAVPELQGQENLSLPLEMAALVLQEERFQGAATACVTELATRLECDRVSIGFLKGTEVKVRALSHSAQFTRQMNLIRDIGLAMSESIDQQAVLVYPEPEGSPHVLHAHENLVRHHDDRAILTVPFVDHAGIAFGAICFERVVSKPFDRHLRNLCDGIAALVGPILEEKRRNDRLLVTKIGDSLWTQVKRLIGPRYAIRKIVAAALLIVVLFFSFATGQYRVTAEAVLEGKVQRAVVAPYRGFIFEAPVRAGDLVREGEVLCRLDDRDLRLEHARLTGEYQQHQLEHRRAMAGGEVAAMNVLSKKMRQAEAQIDLLEEQITRSRIVAPFDGVVVSGDLSQSLGAPVEMGDLLFEVTPLDSYRLMLEVDERDINQIELGQRGDLVLSAFPQTRTPFTVSKITPVSTSEEGRNYFLVEATLDEMSPRLRPGMEGFGKVEIDRRKLIRIWTHDMIDWIRLKVWSWWP